MLTGHPKGLYRLFFIEMWERLAFYTMVGILLLYTIDTDTGGLGLPKVVGNEIYGLYLAFVYFTPYLGGLVADRFLGYRRSVLLGGLFFALGFFLMGIYSRETFVTGLVCLCVGNGFFKPNISVMVGNLYQPGDPKRDAGFNLFYMGINIGAFLANFVAAFVRNEWGWLWVFRTAGLGMLVGITILLASWKVLERADRKPEQRPEDTPFSEILSKILLPAVLAGVAGFLLARRYLPEGIALRPAICGFLAGMVPILWFFVRLPRRASDDEKPGLQALLPVYLCGATFFMVLHLNGSAMTQWAKEATDRRVGFTPERFQEEAYPSYYVNAGPDDPRPNKKSLLVVEKPEHAAMYGQQRMSRSALEEIERSLPEDVRVVHLGDDKDAEQVSELWRRGVDVYEDVVIDRSRDAHGVEVLTVTPAEGAGLLERVALVRTLSSGEIPLFLVDRATFEMLYEEYERRFGRPPQELPPGEFMKIANPELFQSLNPLFVIAFTPLVVWYFARRQAKGRPISTARKIFYGMCLTTAALLVMVAAGAVGDDGTRKVSWWWLVGFYAVVTLGELCLSPMALSLVTKLSPKRLVGLTMGGWFLATAFGNNFSGFFGGLQARLAPTTFFLTLAAIAGAVALFIRLVLPRLDDAIRRYGA